MRVRFERDLFGNELVFGCFRRELDCALSGADWEAWENSLEDAVEAVHVGGLPVVLMERWISNLITESK